VGLLLAAAGCADAPQTQPPPPPPPVEGASVAFEDGDATLTLQPAEVVTLSVDVDPPGAYSVKFTLLGTSVDASLGATTVLSDGSGRGSVDLVASSIAAAFRVRAALDGGGSDQIQISVSDQGFGAVRALPIYEGTRDLESWIAAVAVGATCEDIAGTLPLGPEGALGGTGTDEAVVKGVPVGPSLAVVLRSGEAAWGCANLEKVDVDAVLDVPVTIVDAPLDLTQVSLDVTLAGEPTAPDLAALLASSSGPLLAALDDVDGAAFLAAMVDALDPGMAGDFDAASQQNGWAALAAPAVLQLSPACSALIAAGKETLEPGTFDFTLAPQVDATAYAYASPKTFLGVAAADAGVPPLTLLSFSADAKDVVYVGGSITWLPSRWAGAVASAGAATGGLTVREALAQAMDCGSLALAMGGAGACDAACIEAACGDAVEAIWIQARNASALSFESAELGFTLTGAASVSEIATPVGFAGTWVGTLHGGGEPVSVQGEASGEAVVDVPPT